MELYYSFSVLIVLTALFSYINERFLKLPATIGIMLMAMLVSISVVIAGKFYLHLFEEFSGFISKLDFTEILMGAMLNFLLFAGAIHIKMSDLKEQKGPVMVFSTLSVLISTFVVGILLFYILPLVGLYAPLIECLVFGALISPTDPIAVLGILKKVGVSNPLETKVAGESLFNDGMAVVVFVVLLQLAQGKEIDLSVGNITWLFVKEAIGGIALGVALGVIGVRGMKNVESHNVSAIITLAIVMGGYLVAHSVHISGPLAMVAAGLVVGNMSRREGVLSESARDYLNKFWELIDEIMNAILFLIIGFELILIQDITNYWAIGSITIILVLLARFVSIWVPTKIIPFKTKFNSDTVKILVWGGLRGGVSVALALTIDDRLHKDLFLSITYFVVVFSIFVQGLTIGKVVRRVTESAEDMDSTRSPAV
jgi:CPA1 family monovalent cation:H+ antiporter